MAEGLYGYMSKLGGRSMRVFVCFVEMYAGPTSKSIKQRISGFYPSGNIAMPQQTLTSDQEPVISMPCHNSPLYATPEIASARVCGLLVVRRRGPEARS